MTIFQRLQRILLAAIGASLSLAPASASSIDPVARGLAVQAKSSSATNSSNIATNATAARALVHPGHVAGRWYWNTHATTSSGIIGANTLYLTPWMLEDAITISDLGQRIVANVAATNIAIAIYASDPATKLPAGLPLGNTGSISAATIGVVSGSLGSNLSLAPGLYWVGFNGSSSSIQLINYLQTSIYTTALIGSATLNDVASASNLPVMAYTESSVTFGTWPNLTSSPASLSAGSVGYPCIFKVASVP